MNCWRFQNRLHEYVDGTLSARTQTAADRHLARCTACRDAVSQEQHFAVNLPERLRQGTASLALHPQIRQRIVTALESDSAADAESVVRLWNRFARPLGVAVSLLLIASCVLVNFFSGAKVHKTTPSVGREIRSAVSIEVSYRVPKYKFRQEGDLVVDTLSYETIVASGTLWTGGPERAKEQ
jgi:anti-sigma factor RsiW